MPSSGRPSLAVLYFDNLSGEPELDWLRHGLTDMLVTDLAQSPTLEVLSTDRLYQILSQLHREDERITSFELVREVAEQAAADTVLVGSFMRSGDTIRVNVKIQEAATGRILGTDRVEATGDEAIFAMVDDLTRNIRSHLELPAEVELDRALADVSTRSLEAYRHYVEAMRLHDQLKEEEAGELFLKATELDPEFAMAWARLGTIRSNLFLLEEARAYSGRAMELLDRVTSWERFYIEARHHSLWPATRERAIAVYERALTQYPGDLNFLGNLAVEYSAVERFADAVRIGRQLVERRDSFESTYGNLANALVGLGELEEARRVMDDFLRRMPDSAEGHQALAGSC
jgi:TolB-like protein/Flp pilus assembly protein TadD